ncbi:hypothetical protein QR680_010913 [Steinernema hermaphroditum]|uniref:BTB domain-containing protein n=1 Tax=Steinernema hermaphroditum TaxID=289476 RepID=A0AA39MBG0_9BILA|nr:hypothetical protein QR680_010913 [Steinernema hermaphroditum]
MPSTLVDHARIEKSCRRRLQGPSKLRWKFREADAVIITSDGSRVGISRRKLASYSPFFNAAFFAGFEEARKWVVRLPTIRYERLYEALYLMEKLDSGDDFTFDISLRKALQIFETANFLTLDNVTEWLAKRITELMVPEELVNVYRQVLYQCPKLSNRLHTLIVQNCDKLHANKTIMEFAENEMIDLLEHPRLNLTPSQEKIMVDEFIAHREERDNLALKAMRTEMVKRNDDWGYLGRPRTPNKVLVTFGGWSVAGPSNAVDVYDTRANKWTLPDSRLFEAPKAYHATVRVGRSFYTIGGFNGVDYYSTVRRFNFDSMAWTDVAGMTETRCYVNACVFDNHCRILASGGHNGHARLKTAEIYNIQKNEWSPIADMTIIRSDAHVVNINEKVIVVGGFDGGTCHKTYEYYDDHKNQWVRYSSQMHNSRSGVSAVAINGVIFVTGGFNGHRRLNTSEFVDPREGIWHSARSMSLGRSNFAMAEMDGRIYVSGGFDGGATSDACEVYDFRRDAWSPLPKLNVRRSAGFSAVVEYDDIIDALTHPSEQYKPATVLGNRQTMQQFGLMHGAT